MIVERSTQLIILVFRETVKAIAQAVATAALIAAITKLTEHVTDRFIKYVDPEQSKEE